MRLSESGKITFKAILSLAFLGALIFLAFKTIPVYINDYQLNDYIQNQTPFWQTQHASEDTVRKNVLAKAQDLGLPLAAEDVKAEVNANKVTVTLDYHVPVDLKVYTLQLHFTHSSENRSI
ncbi:MAG: hypothetical protein ABSF45_21435 [Terriglobia bacterium]|jgi:hypothetical protein